MRGPLTSASGNQDRREPNHAQARGRRKGKKKRKGGKRPPASQGPLHDAMVRMAT